jgi:hypothetical protein
MNLYARFFARVRAAFLPALERSAAVRFLDALRVCLDSAACDAELVGSFFNAFCLALERVFETGS